MDWRARCGRTARAVRRQGWPSSRHPYLYQFQAQLGPGEVGGFGFPRWEGLVLWCLPAWVERGPAKAWRGGLVRPKPLVPPNWRDGVHTVPGILALQEAASSWLQAGVEPGSPISDHGGRRLSRGR